MRFLKKNKRHRNCRLPHYDIKYNLLPQLVDPKNKTKKQLHTVYSWLQLNTTTGYVHCICFVGDLWGHKLDSERYLAFTFVPRSVFTVAVGHLLLTLQVYRAAWIRVLCVRRGRQNAIELLMKSSSERWIVCNDLYILFLVKTFFFFCFIPLTASLPTSIKLEQLLCYVLLKKQSYSAFSSFVNIVVTPTHP